MRLCSGRSIYEYRLSIFRVGVDPLENDDLAPQPEYAGKRGEMEAALRTIVDPELVNTLAKENQRIRRLKGGNT